MGLAQELGIDGLSAITLDLVTAAYMGQRILGPEFAGADLGQASPNYAPVLALIQRGSRVGFRLPGVEYLE